MNDLTLKNEIRDIIETLDTNLHDESHYVNKIFKLHVQSEIDLLKEFIEIADKRNYNNIAYHNLLYYKITQLQDKLKE
jgi:hypothetical protein